MIMWIIIAILIIDIIIDIIIVIFFDIVITISDISNIVAQYVGLDYHIIISSSSWISPTLWHTMWD